MRWVDGKPIKRWQVTVCAAGLHGDISVERGTVILNADLSGWRCFHCRQLFTDEGLARQHFGDHVSDLPLCIQYAQKGMGGGAHDPYIRIRKDEFCRILSAVEGAGPLGMDIYKQWKWLIDATI